MGALDRKDMIKVCVRMRPISSQDLSTGSWVADDSTIEDAQSPSVTHSFERVFVPGTPTRDLYDTIVQPVVCEVTAGFNGTIFGVLCCYVHTV